MTTQHTPGPWKVDGEPHDGDGAVIKAIMDDEGLIVAHVIGGDEEMEDWLPEDEVNARLIAAAPQLLEALQALWLAVADARDANGHAWVTPAIADAQRKAAPLLDQLLLQALGEGE